MIKIILLVLALGAVTDGPLFGQASALATDTALIRYLRRTDPFFRQLGPCSHGRIARSNQRGQSHGDTTATHWFTYKATCEIKDEEASDCSYKVELSGTIDTPESATIRRFHWELECAG